MGTDFGSVMTSTISNVIDGNTLQNNGSDGVYIYGELYNNDGSISSDSSDNYDIKNNTISGNGDNGVYLNGDSDYAVDVYVSMYNNEIYNNSAYGVYLYDDNNADWHIDLGKTAGSTTSGYNLFYGNNGGGSEVYNNTGDPGYARYNYWGGGSPSYSGSLFTSPYFTDTALTVLVP